VRIYKTYYSSMRRWPRCRKMLAKGEAQPQRAYDIVRAVTTATGEATPLALVCLKALAPIFGIDPDAP
jgi:hypothetical protein